jgi:hypothetical protein
MKHGYIGTRLRDARVARNVSVQQLASELGIAINTVLDIEAGATLGHPSTIIEVGRESAPSPNVRESEREAVLYGWLNSHRPNGRVFLREAFVLVY